MICENFCRTLGFCQSSTSHALPGKTFRCNTTVIIATVAPLRFALNPFHGWRISVRCTSHIHMSGIDLELRYQCCHTTALPGFPQMAHLTIICGPSFHNTVYRYSGSRTRPSSWGGLCSSSSTDYNMHILACLPCYAFVHWAYNANLIRPIQHRSHNR